MKKLFILFFTTLWVSSYAVNFIELFDASSFHYKLDSFLGTDYFPSQVDNSNSYQEKFIFEAGWKFTLSDEAKIWFDLSYNKQLLNDQIELKSTGISLIKNDWEFIFKSSQLEIGKKSEIFNRNLFSPYFEVPIIADYKFRGLETIYVKNNISISAMAGGNPFNSAIGKLNLNFSNHTNSFDVYYLYCKRDRFFTYPTHTAGFEYTLDTNILNIYSSTAYDKMNSNLMFHPSKERFITLNEATINPFNNFYFGSNILYTVFDWKENEEWISTTFVELKFSKTSNFFSFQYWDHDIGYNRELNLISTYKILDYWSVAANISYFNPSIGNDYYVFGVQTRINYEMD